MKKKIWLLLILFPVFFWSISVLLCEICTMIYGKEFVGEYNQTGMIGGDPIPKVLKYSKTEAKVYYVDEFAGNIIYFKKINNEWIMESWDTVWSTSGSADGFMWPDGRRVIIR